MSEEIFRKKSLDKVKSPDSLDDYIHVSNPGVWLLLASVIVLLAGALVWGVFGHIDSTEPTTVQVKSGQAVCQIDDQIISSVKVGQTVKFGDSKAVIKTIGEKTDAGYVCILSSVELPPDGFYDGKVVVNSYKPLSFVLN